MLNWGPPWCRENYERITKKLQRMQFFSQREEWPPGTDVFQSCAILSRQLGTFSRSVLTAMCIYIYIYRYICIYSLLNISYKGAYIHNMYTYIYRRAYIYIYMHKYINICPSIYIYLYIYIYEYIFYIYAYLYDLWRRELLYRLLAHSLYI